MNCEKLAAQLAAVEVALEKFKHLDTHEPLLRDLYLECERAMKQRDAFVFGGGPAAGNGGSK